MSVLRDPAAVHAPGVVQDRVPALGVANPDEDVAGQALAVDPEGVAGHRGHGSRLWGPAVSVPTMGSGRTAWPRRLRRSSAGIRREHKEPPVTDSFLLHVLVRHVETQAAFALVAWEDLRDERDTQLAFYSIHAMLNAAGAVSKVLWGLTTDGKRERRPLREALGVLPGETWAVRKLTVRNRFEHHDERIFEWWATSTSRDLVDANIGPRAEFLQIVRDPRDVFRHYDQTTGDVWFWGDRLSLTTVADECAELNERASRWIEDVRRGSIPLSS